MYDERRTRCKSGDTCHDLPIWLKNEVSSHSYIGHCFDLKVVTHLKAASEASYDVINMATIMRNCTLIKAMVCVGMVTFIQHERFF